VRAVHVVEEREGRAQTKNPRKRAAEVYEFVEGDAEVLCAGVQAVQLGHNLDAASAVVLPGLRWSLSALSQFEARVHRLTSTRPVSVYVVLTRRSLDERKWGCCARRAPPAT
jgi:SNF2 family DNA or RNA helicase